MLRQTEVITVLGQRGSGKSSWVKKQLPGIPRFILWDTLGEYSEKAGQYEGFPEFDNLSDVYSEIRAAGPNGIFQIVYNSLQDEDLNSLCEIAAAAGPVCFIVEEVDTYATPWDCPIELKALLKKGRHWGVDMIFISRRPAEINRLITSQSQRFIVFRIIEGRDIAYLKSIIGPVADDIPKLDDLNYIDWKHGKTEKKAISWKK